MRVHFITLGIISQVVFGLLPALIASITKKVWPAMRWDIWLALDASLVALVAGFAGASPALLLCE